MTEAFNNEDLIVYETDGNVASITLNRPEKLNTWDFPGQGGLYDSFHLALDKAEKDDDIKVVIIKANGRAFSAGHDLNTVGYVYGMGTGQKGERRASQRRRLEVDRKWTEGLERLFLFPKITIAQVHGYCVGEGLVIVECCDLAIASHDAQFAHSEQRLGFAGSGIQSIPILMMTVGLKRSMELLLTGDQISGEKAAAIGLINKSVPYDELNQEVSRLAQRLSRLSRDGIAIGKATRAMIYDNLGLNFGFKVGYYSHSFFTNLRWEQDEYNFFKERRDKGTREGFHKRDENFEDSDQ